jgi:two-component system NtrC family sensor kinase
LRLRGVTLESALGEGLPQVRADAGELQQVLVNLLMNAADATDGRPARIVTLGSSTVDGRVLLWVRDTGAGIGSEDLQKIFQPFYTTKKGRDGTGLGLSVSLRIVKDLGGDIRVESRVGEGSTFTVSLPAA